MNQQIIQLSINIWLIDIPKSNMHQNKLNSAVLLKTAQFSLKGRKLVRFFLKNTLYLTTIVHKSQYSGVRSLSRPNQKFRMPKFVLTCISFRSTEIGVACQKVSVCSLILWPLTHNSHPWPMTHDPWPLSLSSSAVPFEKFRWGFLLFLFLLSQAKVNS